eukprot:scaffold245987_cov19-Tisochrysis_lutea.AAC.1
MQRHACRFPGSACNEAKYASAKPNSPSVHSPRRHLPVWQEEQLPALLRVLAHAGVPACVLACPASRSFGPCWCAGLCVTQALEGWEARVLEGAARAGVPLEEVLGTEAVDRYKASLLDRMPQTPPQPPLPLPPQQP